MTESSPWRSRIVGHGQVAPGDLISNPRNWRTHGKAQQDALAGVLDQVGWVQDVIVNQRTGHLVDGHLRVDLAIVRNELEIPVVYVDLDEQEEALILATLDPLSAMATTDPAQYDALLRDVDAQSAAVQALLGKQAADAGLYKFNPEDEWQGMPEFEQEEQEGYHLLTLHFATEEDMLEFAALIGQAITKSTRYLWIPRQEPIDGKQFRVSES